MRRAKTIPRNKSHPTTHTGLYNISFVMRQFMLISFFFLSPSLPDCAVASVTGGCYSSNSFIIPFSCGRDAVYIYVIVLTLIADQTDVRVLPPALIVPRCKTSSSEFAPETTYSPFQSVFFPVSLIVAPSLLLVISPGRLVARSCGRAGGLPPLWKG